MFVDQNSKIDHEGLRQYVLTQLQQFRQQAVVLTQEKSHFWDRLALASKASLSDKEQRKVIAVINQIKSLVAYIDGWIRLSVDTPERFDFFVATKAHELRSGSQEHDYFWALQIRHDQLVALTRVMEFLISKMSLWTELKPDKVFDDPVFAGLTDYGIEDQVYLEAEKVYRERTQMLQSKTV